MGLVELYKQKRAPNEAMTLTVLGNVRTGLEEFNRLWKGYPDSLQDLQARGMTGGYDFASGSLYGYVYRYQPAPESCAEGECSSFALTLVPRRSGEASLRSFYLDQFGVIRHCTGATGATAADPPVDQPPVLCAER
jgi:hypothetical protein